MEQLECAGASSVNGAVWMEQCEWSSVNVQVQAA